MIGTVLTEGQHQRVTAARMNMAFGQKRHARGASPEALLQATVIGGIYDSRWRGGVSRAEFRESR